jgi:hypothetical protein
MSPKFGLLGLVGAVLSFACDPRVCADRANLTQTLAQRLSETGLFQDLEREHLQPGVFAYAPEFELWSDGADKRRWVFVPNGAQVDTSDLENWRFPEGSKLWKEFSRDGVHLETRLLQKTGSGDADWAAAAYLWRKDQSDAELSPYGALDALGTTHNVPASGECFACHDGRPNRVLGFSAIQLAPRSEASPERLTEEARRALFASALPTLDVPGTQAERAALGYLHANCSHCHNQSGAAKSAEKCLNPHQELDFDLDFTLYTDRLTSVDSTATYRTALGEVIERGNPDASKLVQVMASRQGGLAQMPPLGSERADEQGLSTLRSWIGEL